MTDIERGLASGEFLAGTDPELLLDAIVPPVYLRLLLGHPALTEEYKKQLIDQALLGIRTPNGKLDKSGNTQQVSREEAPKVAISLSGL